MARIECDNPEAAVQEAFWLAWQACGGPLGMGLLQNDPTATKEDVLLNVVRSGDYPGMTELAARGVAQPARQAPTAERPGSMYADYVFGRMMKLSLRWDDKAVILDDSKPQADYQSWCRRYPTYEALVLAAVESLRRPN